MKHPCGKLVRPDDFPCAYLPNGVKACAIISERDGAPRYSMRLFEVPRGGVIEEHSHEWEHEIFVLEGSGLVKVGDCVHEVSPGSALFIPGEVPHSYMNGDEIPLRFICIVPNEGNVELLRSIDDQIKGGEQPL